MTTNRQGRRSRQRKAKRRRKLRRCGAVLAKGLLAYMTAAPRPWFALSS